MPKCRLQVRPTVLQSLNTWRVWHHQSSLHQSAVLCATSADTEQSFCCRVVCKAKHLSLHRNVHMLDHDACNAACLWQSTSKVCIAWQTDISPDVQPSSRCALCVWKSEDLPVSSASEYWWTRSAWAQVRGNATREPHHVIATCTGVIMHASDACPADLSILQPTKSLTCFLCTRCVFLCERLRDWSAHVPQVTTKQWWCNHVSWISSKQDCQSITPWIGFALTTWCTVAGRRPIATRLLDLTTPV